MVDIVQIEGSMPLSSNRTSKKRYKQYTRGDLMAAVEEVRNGMSALEASKMYRVPSRTLYGKLQKMQHEKNKDAIPSTKLPFQFHLAMENFVHGSRSAFDVIDAIGRHTCTFCGLHTRRPRDEEAVLVQNVGKFSCRKCNERFYLSREIAKAHSLESQTLRKAPEVTSKTSSIVAIEDEPSHPGSTYPMAGKSVATFIPHSMRDIPHIQIQENDTNVISI